jgi:cytochrome c heme-lyase
MSAAPSPSTPPAGSGCPVQHKGAAAPKAEGCPVQHKGAAAPTGKVYDVYGREIDPLNQMAADPTPGQLPVPGQQVPLSTGRVQSTIPKGGTDSTWLYPSPQMFLNALSRKKKADDITEKDAEAIVAIHNNMNERTWVEVLRWESLHSAKCPDPKLLRFMGRPHDLSPLARLRTLTG